ncbi:hypothetical protein KUL42_24060 [Alteromonas sp. KUL42]|nr:hypothetical protein KUL42_24060 [Alteromonas sp. KUL42]
MGKQPRTTRKKQITDTNLGTLNSDYASATGKLGRVTTKYAPIPINAAMPIYAGMGIEANKQTKIKLNSMLQHAMHLTFLDIAPCLRHATRLEPYLG